MDISVLRERADKGDAEALREIVDYYRNQQKNGVRDADAMKYFYEAGKMEYEPAYEGVVAEMNESFANDLTRQAELAKRERAELRRNVLETIDKGLDDAHKRDLVIGLYDVIEKMAKSGTLTNEQLKLYFDIVYICTDSLREKPNDLVKLFAKCIEVSNTAPFKALSSDPISYRSHFFYEVARECAQRDLMPLASEYYSSAKVAFMPKIKTPQNIALYLDFSDLGVKANNAMGYTGTAKAIKDETAEFYKSLSRENREAFASDYASTVERMGDTIARR